MTQAHLTRKMLILFLLDYDFVTFHLPVSSNINNTDEVDMCPIQEESTDPKDLLAIEPSHCAEQLTIMDAVSKFCSYSVSLHSKCFQLSDCAKVRAGAEKKMEGGRVCRLSRVSYSLNSIKLN